MNVKKSNFNSYIYILFLDHFCEQIVVIRWNLWKLHSSEMLLTHICRVDPSILINWTSPLPILGVSGVRFHFYSISNKYSCYQTVKILIRRRKTRRLIWVCTVCLYPKNGTLGLYGLTNVFGNNVQQPSSWLDVNRTLRWPIETFAYPWRRLTTTSHE